MLRLFKNTTLIKYIVGYASNTNYVICTEEPNEVRVFSSSYPNGLLLVRNTSGPLDPNEWEWNASEKKVVLGQTHSGTVVCYAGSMWLFNNTPIPVNSSYAEQFTIKNTSNTLKATAIQISGFEVFDHSESSANMLSFSTNGTNYYNTLSLSDIDPNGSVNIYVKATTGENPITLRNLNVRISYTLVFKE